MPGIRIEHADVEFVVDSGQPESIAALFSGLFRRSRVGERVIRALEDVTLSINTSETVGIIGPNGAGKSTLLKVMARIYKPGRGQAETTGHVCPLFEFITGFEMDASGWDNIRTRALLLGMSAKEVREKTSDIASFSGLGDFLDLPVRTYSAGMLLRLAFSTSTAVEPEILLLDEVMAAGDAEFLEKARRRMEELIGRASIVVFATHSLEALPAICSRAIWLDRGKVLADGPTEEVIGRYREDVSQKISRESQRVGAGPEEERHG